MNNFSVPLPTPLHSADHPSEIKESLGNWALGTFLSGARANDPSQLLQGYDALAGMAKLIAANLHYESNSKDYWDILHDFLATELRKSESLTREEISQLQRANKFAYVRTALRRDFIDDLMGAARKERLHAQYDDLKEKLCQPFSQSEEPLEHFEQSARAESEPLLDIERLTANVLSNGEAAICQTLLSILNDSKQRDDFANSQCSDTKCKSKFVKYVAAKRGVGSQVVRRDIKRLKDKLNCSHGPQIREMLLGWLGTCTPPKVAT